MFLMGITGLVAYVLVEATTVRLLGDSGLSGDLADLLNIGAMVSGARLGDAIFNAARRRYLSRQR